MKKNRNIMAPLIAFCVIAILAAVMLFVYFNFKPKPVAGSKEITVEVVIPEAETKEFTIHTDAEYLRQALEEENLIKGDNSSGSLYITEVNGHAADTSKEWWCITKDGVMLSTGADSTVIADGDHYELTLSPF